MLAVVALAIVAAFAAGGAVATYLARRSSPHGDGAQGGRRMTRTDVHLAADPTALPASTIRRDEQRSAERAEASHDLALMDRVLRDVCDLAQGDEAILWRWVEARDSLSPMAWSTPAERPTAFRVRDWGSLLRWSAEQRTLQTAASDDGSTHLVAVPIEGGGRLRGVLTVTSDRGLGLDADGLHEWMPRFAGQIGGLIELVDMRRDYGRYLRQTQALLEAVQRLQDHTSVESLGRAICETAMDVTTADAATLVRWLPNDVGGVVQAVTEGASGAGGQSVHPESLVGRACTSRLPLALGDARSETAARSIYSTERGGEAVGSVTIVPIIGAQQVVGAIVVESREPDALGDTERQNLGLLAAATRGSLEMVWAIQEVALRARTDPLTRLWNRGHFDEQMARVLNETDRFGGCCSLIVADIDHFKQVNDTHGHEAGDAVLRFVAASLKDAVRTVDVCARYGGEEIAILLPQTEPKGAYELAERLRKRLEERPVAHGGESIAVTASFGVATYPEPVPYGDWLFMAADRAMYAAKEAGRNCVRSISPTDVTTKLYRSARPSS